MVWGIVVDTSGSNGTNLSLIANGINSFSDTSNGFLSVGGALTSDYYFWNDASLSANQVTNAGPPHPPTATSRPPDPLQQMPMA